MDDYLFTSADIGDFGYARARCRGGGKNAFLLGQLWHVYLRPVRTE
jgi:hypothetical protein